MSESSRDPAGDAVVPDAPQNSPKLLRAYQSGGAWVLFLVPAVAGLVADQWLKYWSFPQGVSLISGSSGRNPDSLHPWPVIPNVLGFVTTVNQGAVFGFGQGKVGIFLALSVVALAVILWVFVTSEAQQRAVHLALGLITAGAIGNLYDRAVFHGVRDMLRFYVDWYPYIFNLADVLLCIGVPLLIVRWMFVKEPAENSAPGAINSKQA